MAIAFFLRTLLLLVGMLRMNQVYFQAHQCKFATPCNTLNFFSSFIIQQAEDPVASADTLPDLWMVPQWILLTFADLMSELVEESLLLASTKVNQGAAWRGS